MKGFVLSLILLAFQGQAASAKAALNGGEHSDYPSPTMEPPPSTPESFSGTVASVKPNGDLTIQEESGITKKIKSNNPNISAYRNGNLVPLSNLMPGETVTIKGAPPPIHDPGIN